MPDYVLSAHAEIAVKELSIAIEWLERVLRDPEKSETDKDDVRLMHALSRIAENENRVLRVVYNGTVKPITVVTVYFDRTLRHRL